MKLISVYVTVGVITFVKCEVRYNSVTLVNRNQMYRGLRLDRRDFQAQTAHAGESDIGKRERELQAELGENPNGESNHEVSLEESSGGKRDFFQVLGQVKNIYEQCKTTVDKRLNNLIKANVKSRLSELKSYILSVYQCVKVFSFRALDDTLQDDLIPVTDYVYFVRDGANDTEDVPSGRAHSVPLKDFAARVLGREWTALVGDWLENLLRTHSLKFQLDKSLVSQGRRRRDHRMFAMMVMGFMIMASILIPMGFQFLTVLGGKSLLLAKMALIMSAINGLKKIATSNVGYGFYHTGSDAHHHDHLHHGFHEKHYHVNPQNYNAIQGYN